ncbi:hypothetical protein [Desulfotignum balticum]|uniref:hypothetical protein n=1 Tax=Desulfotignum balticum TaxID=115781 RepID=UPI000402758C|nr:hypothetical protein [Desulfotignum balticum]
MSLFTETELNEEIARWKAALKAVSLNQSYSIAGRMFTRVDRAEIWAQLKEFEKEKNKLTGRGTMVGMQGRVAR